MAKVARESYFDLPVSDQADVLQSLAPVMGRRAEILEKDIWLCQVLDILFQLPCRKPMAFKGGTSRQTKRQALSFQNWLDALRDRVAKVSIIKRYLNSALEDGDETDLMLALRTLSEAFGGVQEVARQPPIRR
jgi:hypothetical protein